MTGLSRQVLYLRVLVARELRDLKRDPVTLVLTLVAPVLAALIASVGLGSPPKIDATVVVVGSNARLGDPSALTELAAPSTGGNTPLRWQLLDSEAKARDMVRKGKAVAALILPRNDAGASATVGVVVNRNAHLVADLAISAARTLASRLSLGRFDATRKIAVAPTAIVVSSPGRRALNGGELYGPAIAVFFLFLASGFVARGLHAERERGTLDRLRAMPISTGTIVAAKTLAMLTVAVAEFTVVLVTMSIFYGARWGSILALGAITVALSLAVAAVAVMIGAFAHSYQAAAAIVAFVALALAVLGGNLVPLQNLPDVMRRIATFTPNGVAIRAFHDIAANDRGVGDVAGALARILGFGVVVGTLGFARLRQTVEA